MKKGDPMNLPEVEASDDVSTIIAKFAAELKEPARPFTLLVRFRVNEGEHAEIEAAFAEARGAGGRMHPIRIEPARE